MEYEVDSSPGELFAEFGKAIAIGQPCDITYKIPANGVQTITFYPRLINTVGQVYCMGVVEGSGKNARIMIELNTPVLYLSE
ncbi:MAG: hypothetical protein EOO17_04655 [Chloroflexi bacterium]|nr:MAG: hypothetical protein EOO17_04655 [Chloroflexota bacterium]